MPKPCAAYCPSLWAVTVPAMQLAGMAGFEPASRRRGARPARLPISPHPHEQRRNASVAAAISTESPLIPRLGAGHRRVPALKTPASEMPAPKLMNFLLLAGFRVPLWGWFLFCGRNRRHHAFNQAPHLRKRFYKFHVQRFKRAEHALCLSAFPAYTSCISIPRQFFICRFFSRYTLSLRVASLLASITVKRPSAFSATKSARYITPPGS